LANVNDKIKEAEVAAKIKQTFKSKKIRARNVIVGLSGLHCLSRPITLPQLPRAMLEEAVLREAKRVLPVPTEQLYISWQTIPCPGEDKIRGFLVGIPCHIADNLIRILRLAGLKPSLMDIKPIALARVAKEATAIIIDVQQAELDIVIMVDGVPQPVRTITFPSAELSLKEKIALVKSDLNRTIEFYNSNNPEKPLDSSATILVSGELADEPDQYQALAAELGYAVSPLLSPLTARQELDPTHYMANIGLTLKQLENEAGPLVTNVNALPVPYRPKPISISKLTAVPATVIVIGLLVLLVMNMQTVSADIGSVQSKLDNANHIIQYRQSQKKVLVDNIAELKKNIAGTIAMRDAFNNALNSLDVQGEVINGDLVAIMDNIMDSVDLSSISHNKDKLTVLGTALGEFDILKYSRNLDATGRFSEITIASINRLEDEEGGGGGDSAEEMAFMLILTTEE